MNEQPTFSHSRTRDEFITRFEQITQDIEEMEQTLERVQQENTEDLQRMRQEMEQALMEKQREHKERTERMKQHITELERTRSEMNAHAPSL